MRSNEERKRNEREKREGEKRRARERVASVRCFLFSLAFVSIIVGVFVVVFFDGLSENDAL